VFDRPRQLTSVEQAAAMRLSDFVTILAFVGLLNSCGGGGGGGSSPSVPADHFILRFDQPTATVGSSFGFSVTAYDAAGNIDSGYAGTVRLSVTDPKATVDCCSGSFAGSGGGKEFVVTFFTTGIQSITVTDTSGPASGNSGPLTVTNPSPPVLDPTAPQGAALNKPYAFIFVASGYPPITFSATGQLPPGLHPVTSDGLLTGTPAATGTYAIQVQAVDGVGQRVTQDFLIQVYSHGFALTPGTMSGALTNHTATLLSSNLVLIAGGWSNTAEAVASAELFDPATGLFFNTGSMSSTRSSHSASLLCDISASSCTDHRVLVAGGFGGNGEDLATAELFDPATGTFAPTGNMTAAREFHSATLLANGKVLITGGQTQSVVRADAELFDPATGTFTATGNMAAPRVLHTATLLKNGNVLIAGGSPMPAAAELYDPNTGTFSASGTLTNDRSDHTATLLPDGRVLICGGFGQDGALLASAEIYDPVSGTFTSTGSLVTARHEHAAALLTNGTVLVAGGRTEGSSTYHLSSAYAEVFDPTTGIFTQTGGLQIPRLTPTMTALPLGSSALALVTGGANDTGSADGTGGTETALATAEWYQ
jgi:Galactose oxidase, central domain